MNHESIAAKNFIGLQPLMFSPVNLSTSTVVRKELHLVLSRGHMNLRFCHFGELCCKRVLRNEAGPMRDYGQQQLYVACA